jgi:hypothetical protein
VDSPIYNPAMDRLPPELLARVCQFASIDGGATAGRLRLVSRRICATADLYRFYTVSISGIRAIERLVQALQASPRSQRTIVHLFLSDKHRDQAWIRSPEQLMSDPTMATSVHAELSRQMVWLMNAPLSTDVGFSMPNGCNTAAMQEWVNTVEARRLECVIPSLLRHAAPHLRSLTLLIYNPRVNPTLLLSADPFPKLASLDLQQSGHHTPFYSSHLLATPAPRLTMPALSSLTLSFTSIDALQALRHSNHFFQHCCGLTQVVVHLAHSAGVPLSVSRSLARDMATKRELPSWTLPKPGEAAYTAAGSHLPTSRSFSMAAVPSWIGWRERWGETVDTED